MKLELDIEREAPRYAGFWIRFLAFLIDSVVFMLGVVWPLMWLMGASQIPLDLSMPPEQLLAATQQMLRGMLVQHAVLLVLYVFFWVKFVATPAKLLLGLQVVQEGSLAPLSPLASVLRYLGYFISSFAFGLGFIWVAIDKKKRGFHDMMAGSVVIYKPTPAGQSTH